MSNIEPITTAELIQRLLAQQRYETARRLCMTALAENTGSEQEYLPLLHDAYRALGDIPSACQVLTRLQEVDPLRQMEILLGLAEDYHLVSEFTHYRDSDEGRAGLTGEEYYDLKQKEASKYFARAADLAVDDARRQQVAQVLRRCKRQAEAEQLLSSGQPVLSGIPSQWSAPRSSQTTKATTATAALATGKIEGVLRFADGRPVIHRLLTLGLAMELNSPDPVTYRAAGMGYNPTIGEQEALTAITDDTGAFCFPSVPAGRHEFLAVTLDPRQEAIATRFVAQWIEVAAGQTTRLAPVVDEWHSAPVREVDNPLPAQLHHSGVNYRQVQHLDMSNPFHFDFPRQPVSFTLVPGVSGNPQSLLLLESQDPDQPQPFQLSHGTLTCFTSLPPLRDRVLALYEAMDGPARPHGVADLEVKIEDHGTTAVLDSGMAAFRIPWGDGADNQAPVLAVRASSGHWRGQGRLVLPGDVTVTSRHTQLLESGPLVLKVRINYQLSNHKNYAVELTLHRNEAYLQAREICPDIEGMAFEFSLRECLGGRGFLHWTPEVVGGTRHWVNLEARERELARLQESVAWWLPPQGFGYAMTPSSTAVDDDYIGMFTLRRGEWIDRKFARLCSGPVDGNYELDWPYPEMVGSNVSMITAHTTADGDALFRLRSFDGERQWGLLASNLRDNEGPEKEISRAQHKLSSPRLQDFKSWNLDQQDIRPRPFVVAERDRLVELRDRTDDPVYAPYWQSIIDDPYHHGPVAGVRFAIDQDPRVAWRIKRKLLAVAPIYSKMCLLGRDYSDTYSPVGARPLGPWAEEYDLVAASGVFTAEEERLLRSFFMLMAYMYMEEDLMNWRFNARNCNFEADRIKVVGTMAIVFSDNPDSPRLLAHALECLTRTIAVYTTPGSGKWFENPACYYIGSLTWRVNVIFEATKLGLMDPTTAPHIKEFLHWAILLATPRFPHCYEILRDGCTDAEYRSQRQVRRIPPIGDHARLGNWYPEHYALMANLFRKSDPAFADFLLWAYQEGGSDGGLTGNKPLVLCRLDNEDLALAPSHELVSRRLEGFGASFRGNFGKEDEFYLLFKLGPGGYRYHRTEGSILLFADGKPLIYDGGEGGETWRHSTLSFHDTHMPLAPGHIERFGSFPGLDFAQGVNPKALAPGDNIFMSDTCEVELAPVAYERFNEPHPANSRSVVWVKDEYVVLHDELHLDPAVDSHWHLQVVADQESGNAQEGFHFVGCHGTDLQVLLPGQVFRESMIETVPMLEYLKPNGFAQRHLQLTGDAPDHYLAVLRPLPTGKRPLTASEVIREGRTMGVKVQGDGIDDLLLLSRQGMNVTVEGMQFTGRYAMVAHRDDRTEYALLDGDRLETPDLTLISNGPAVYVSFPIKGEDMRVFLSGAGTAHVIRNGQTVEFQGTPSNDNPGWRRVNSESEKR